MQKRDEKQECFWRVPERSLFVPDAIDWSKLAAGGWPGKGREGDIHPLPRVVGTMEGGRWKGEDGRWKMEEGCRTPSKRLAHGTWAGGLNSTLQKYFERSFKDTSC